MGTCARIGCGAELAETGKRRGRPRKYCSDACARLALRKRKTSLQQNYRSNLETALAAPECCQDARHPHIRHTAPREPTPPGFDSPVRGFVTYANSGDDMSYYLRHQGEGKPCGPKRKKCDQHNQFRSFEQDNLRGKLPEIHAVNETEDQVFVLTDLMYDRNGKATLGSRIPRGNPDSWVPVDADDKRQDAELAKLEQKQYTKAA